MTTDQTTREAAEAIYRQLEHLDPTTRYKIVDAIDELAQEEIALRWGDKKNVV